MKRFLFVLCLCLFLMAGCNKKDNGYIKELEALMLPTPEPAVQGIERPVNVGDVIEIGLAYDNKLDLDWSGLLEYPTHVTPTETPPATAAPEPVVNEPFPTINPYGIYEIPIIFPVKPVFPETLTSYEEDEEEGDIFEQYNEHSEP